jgi:hypothetical protein
LKLQISGTPKNMWKMKFMILLTQTIIFSPIRGGSAGKIVAQFRRPGRVPTCLKSSLLSSSQLDLGQISHIHRLSVTEREIMLSFALTSLDVINCTRPGPPAAWLMSSGSAVKVIHSKHSGAHQSMEFKRTPSSINEGARLNSTLDVYISRFHVRDSLNILRKNCFQSLDISRVLRKGPWILAFAIESPLLTMLGHLKALGFDVSQCVHIVSHCPYLLAQYCHYCGRDVSMTIQALLELDFSTSGVLDDIMRFPTILVSPPKRVSRWKTLLQVVHPSELVSRVPC